ncbi:MULTISPECIES: tetratricopeptide repeat protein [unclassified Microcoleus]|uniref:tetratricopeptide repeat protein n=1 Tax=unclassified Microcoleus TaxID=2642155 RepID=UPI002FD0AEFF
MKFKILTGLLTGLVGITTNVVFCQPSRAANDSFFNNGTLKYINTAILNAEPVMCAAVNQEDTGTNRTLLLTLKQGSDTEATLKKLPKVDLTVVEFTNSQKYSVAHIGNSDLAAGEKAEDFLIQGEEKYRKGDRQGAIEDLSKAIGLNPNYAEAYYNRGILRYVSGDKQGAIADFNEVLRINPNLFQAYVNRGNARDDSGDSQGAIADYNEALRINPSDSKAYYNRGVTRSRLGDNQSAIADYNEALRINPNYAKAYNVRGYARAELGDKQGAIQDFQKAAELFQQQGDRDNYNRAINNLNKLQ